MAVSAAGCAGAVSDIPPIWTGGGRYKLARLLYLCNGPEQRSVAKLDHRFESWGLDVDCRWAYAGDFPEGAAGYDGIFLSGSPHGAYEDIEFIQHEHDFINEAASVGIPMLGICFGSQILASALCGRDQVFRRSHCEIGYEDLTVTSAAAEDAICTELGGNVYMFVWHNDEVRAGHDNMTILAYSDDCPNHVWRYRDQPIWGIQGHPEITEKQALIWFEENRARMEADGADVDSLKSQAHPTLRAKTMLSRFSDLVKSGS